MKKLKRLLIRLLVIVNPSFAFRQGFHDVAGFDNQGDGSIDTWCYLNSHGYRDGVMVWKLVTYVLRKVMK